MPLRLEVVAIERLVYQADDVDMVMVPGAEGVMGILPRHEPVVSALQPGEIEIVRGEERELLAIGGGFVEVRGTAVVVMADAAEQADEIDIERAEEARRRAQEHLSEAPSEQDMERALASLRRAEVRLKVARHARRRRPSGQVTGGESAPE
jgi:F-type H+-transporting ATPase subunit epsilon